MRKAQMHDIAILFLRYHFGGETDLRKWLEIAVDGIKVGRGRTHPDTAEYHYQFVHKCSRDFES